MVPDLANVVHDVMLAGCDHLIGDFHKQGGHSLGRIVVLGDTVDHSDSVHQTWNVLDHCGLGK